MKRPLGRVGLVAAPARTLLTPSKAALVDAACRTDFASFVAKCFHQLVPGREYLRNWHIEAIAYYLEMVRRGPIKRLIINAPPRGLKSLMASVSFPAFVLGHDPGMRIIGVSYGADLAVKLGNDFRAIVDAEWYRRLFPQMQLSRFKNTELEVLTSRHGFRLGTSIDGPLTGRGGDIIIIDDPLKPTDAFSASRREHVNEWYSNTLISRLDNKLSSAIVVVMQRLHVDDLCGTLLRSGENWILLNLPAIAEFEQMIPISPSLFHKRCVGNILHPEWEPMSALERLRAQLGPDIFRAQYQQCPMPPEGAMIKRHWIGRYERSKILDISDYRILQSWDTAQKKDGQNDYSVCTTWAWRDNFWFLMEVLRGRFDYPTLKASAIDSAKIYRPERILIEDAGVGSALADELKAYGLSADKIKPDRDKVTRLSVQSAKFQSGLVYFPKDAPWLRDLEDELFGEPEDLSENLIVQLGVATEALNRVEVINETIQFGGHPAMNGMLNPALDVPDGPPGVPLVPGAVFEAKFMLPWAFSETAASEKHMAQLQHYMWVTSAKSAFLSIITGGGKWIEMTIPADALYQHFLVTAERKFWRCVQTGETPCPYGLEPPRPRIEAVRVVDMSGSNSWAEFAGLFCSTRSAFLAHERAKAELKALMPEDAKEAAGHGVRAKRSKSGAVSFDILPEEGSHAAV
jgi:predicted phage terminase large subunit-like protein